MRRRISGYKIMTWKLKITTWTGNNKVIPQNDSPCPTASLESISTSTMSSLSSSFSIAKESILSIILSFHYIKPFVYNPNLHWSLNIIR
jgi:hypothetical protein